MKKLLITGGVLFSIMPAMAADLELPDLIQQNGSGDCSDETSDAFYTTPVTMQAVYVTDTCPAGQYFNVGSNAEIDSTTGQITGASCQNCTDGHYCPSAINIAVNNGVLSTQGLDNLCPAGTYADSNRTSLTECDACPAGTYQTQTGQSSCNNARAGYYIVSATQTDVQCPYGYRDGAAGTGTSIDACSKTVDATYCANLNPCANFHNIVTSGNSACSTSVNSNNANIVNGALAFGAKNTEPVCLANFTCASGYDTGVNLYQWIIDNSGRITSYSNCSIDGQYGNSCSTQERGTVVWKTNPNDIMAPFAEVHAVAKCSAVAPANNVYHVADSTTNFNNPGPYCWLKVIDFPNQEWFIGGPGGQNQAECEATCGVTMASATYPFGDIDEQTNQYAVNPNALFSFNVMADLTENDSTVKVCAANTITITWGGIADPGAAGTCTYGETFTAPNSTPAAATGFKFIGWTPVESGN